MVFSFFLNCERVFLLLLRLEVGILGLLSFVCILIPNKFVLSVFVFVIGSIVGLVLFMGVIKEFGSLRVRSWVF